MSHPFLGEGEPRGGGVPVCNGHQGKGGQGVGDRDKSPFPRRGGGTVMRHLFQGEVGYCDESSSPRRGWGDRDESPFPRRDGGP